MYVYVYIKGEVIQGTWKMAVDLLRVCLSIKLFETVCPSCFTESPPPQLFLPRSPMWRCPSCLSMRWMSLTRCQDTCWTWMTRQALWRPWQRPCWLAVSPRLVFHWQVPCSSEGTVGLRIICQLTFPNTFLLLPLCNLSPLFYIMCSNLYWVHFTLTPAALSWELTIFLMILVCSQGEQTLIHF